AGRQLAAALARGTEHRLLGFLDDDGRLHGNSLDGRTVYPPAALPRLIPELGVTDLLLALPSVTHQRRLQVLESLRHLPVRVRTMPGMSDLAAGRVSLNDVRELEIEDLLGREPVTPDALLLQRLVLDKVVLITGAGGSIGSELCRQIAACRPHTLLLVENSEFALYQIHHELTALVGGQIDPLDVEEGEAATPMAVKLVPLLASVQDPERMAQIMQTWRPHAVYHA
ncbi:MAG: polysaccharide biosynthesis protein, partial [Ralstonia sp.]|nr:polysaccharide biosynthesis protein [Ralstonia sp.]